jgi:hypothetical protein
MIGRRRKDSMTGIHLILKFVRRTGNSARRFVTTYGSRNDMGETQPICRPALTSAQRKRAFGLLAAALAGCLVLTSARLPDVGLSQPFPAEAGAYSARVFMDDLQRRALCFFTEQTDATTGLTRDRSRANGEHGSAPASIAATGFALTSFCIGDSRGWMPRTETVSRTLTVLRFIRDNVDHEHGFMYHFVDVHTGHRVWKSEASTIDTALFLKGALFAREYLHHPEVTALVDEIYGRVDWAWATNGGKTLTHGWKPETGFLKARWDSYSEMLGMYLLAIGAPAHALSPESWNAWQRPVKTYGNRSFIDCPPLFTHQYSHAYFDFRGRHDAYADYWRNSVDATLAQREWCATLAPKFSRWSLDVWGITASDSAKGYVDWGGPLSNDARLDGTVVPCAPGGSLPFAPRECLKALMTMRAIGGDAVWGRYGFPDAFNPQTGWVSRDVLAIDVGITLLMAENSRTGLVWNYFMQADEAKRGMALCGFSAQDSTGAVYAAAQ